MEQLLQWATNYGLGIVLSIGLAILMYRLVFYILNQNQVREAKLADIIQTNLTQLNVNMQGVISILKTEEQMHYELKRANDHQREEHNRIETKVDLLTERIK